MMPLSVPENIEYSFISEVIEAFIRDVAVYDINHPERTISDKYSLCSDLMRLVLEKITEAMHLSGVNSTESDGKIESYFFNLLQNTEGESAKYLESQVAIIVEWLPKILSGLNRETNFATYQSILEILIKPYNNIIRTAHDLDDNRSTTAIAYSEHDEMMWNFVRYTLNTEAKDFAIVREFEELYWAFEIIKLWDNLEFRAYCKRHLRAEYLPSNPEAILSKEMALLLHDAQNEMEHQLECERNHSADNMLPQKEALSINPLYIKYPELAPQTAIEEWISDPITQLKDMFLRFFYMSPSENRSPSPGLDHDGDLSPIFKKSIEILNNKNKEPEPFENLDEILRENSPVIFSFENRVRARTSSSGRIGVSLDY